MKILGLEFRPMTDDEYNGIMDVEPGSYLCETVGATLVWSPTEKTLSEVYEDENDKVCQRDWKIGETFVCT